MIIFNIITKVLAQTTTPVTGFILPACAVDGNCSLCDFIIGFVNISNFILAIVGSVALLFFIYGGFVWLTAGGREDKIKHGSAVMVNTIIGILIIFGAWMAINFTVSSLATGNEPNLFNGTTAWYNYCTEGLACTGKQNGESCGDNLVCQNGNCLTACAYNNSTATITASCFTSQVSGYTCTQTDCPNQQYCCVPTTNE